MGSSEVLLMIIIFSLTIIFMLWRPFGINETIPTTIGAAITLLIGIVPLTDILAIFNIVSGASLTIISTIMMSIVLESIGFFKWIAINIVSRSRGSGLKLFLYIMVLCFLMTMFFNNDGSILITTPIIIHVVTLLKLKPHQKFPYLISGALIATAASAPIAVSNISNLIALKIVGLSLNSYIEMMFVPSMIGIFTLGLLLYLYFRRDLPKKVLNTSLKLDKTSSAFLYSHPLDQSAWHKNIDWWMFKVSLFIVVLTRICFFVLSSYGIPLEWIGLTGAFVLILIRWYRNGIGIKDIILKTPWHILLFAFNMYVLVYGLKNVGINDFLILHLQDYIHRDPLYASFIMGSLLTVMSNLFNNLPAVMIGTIAITEMGLETYLLQIAYLANVIGSDIGALLTPVGTLATLIWFHILKSHSIKVTWAQYLKVTLMVIPFSLFISILALYLWITWLFV
ncbi:MULTISPECIES: arsenic transporter [Cytobacillus]|uniref:arsenic transporter n=1 Tax=Cytobacillus TaxID=2675230 RepID=UPI001D13E5F9|nr:MULTISPECIES: arsenic transporter [Cytobacillus]MCC3645854.1 arsenic transporter [Cytobacillus oceanisediminis]MCS0652453.1 arsenic transporter [Cytobacillus firmus]MCU1804347.1 arsenic transporter [Cytobacillus firmus]WHY36045.1 arsenic transporter [Cytobacillus firmus]